MACLPQHPLLLVEVTPDLRAANISAYLRGLDGPVQPEWSMERFAKPGVLCFADTTQPFCKHALDLRLYQALQARQSTTLV